MCRCFSRTCLLFNAKWSLQKRVGKPLYSPGFLEKEDWRLEYGDTFNSWESIGVLGSNMGEKRTQNHESQNQIHIFHVLACVLGWARPGSQRTAFWRWVAEAVQPRSLKEMIRKDYWRQASKVFHNDQLCTGGMKINAGRMLLYYSNEQLLSSVLRNLFSWSW